MFSGCHFLRCLNHEYCHNTSVVPPKWIMSFASASLLQLKYFLKLVCSLVVSLLLSVFCTKFVFQASFCTLVERNEVLCHQPLLKNKHKHRDKDMSIYTTVKIYLST